LSRTLRKVPFLTKLSYCSAGWEALPGCHLVTVL